MVQRDESIDGGGKGKFFKLAMRHWDAHRAEGIQHAQNATNSHKVIRIVWAIATTNANGGGLKDPLKKKQFRYTKNIDEKTD